MVDDLSKDSQELMKSAEKGKFAEVMVKVNTLNKEAAAKFITGLSADQKKAYKDLTGDEFKGKIEFGMGMGKRPNKDKE
jgi:hypothetical protein